MNGFLKLQERLQQEGWYLGWALPCCQSCAWGCLPFVHEEGPFKGQDIDFDKVLFNHEQDCQIEGDWDEETEEFKMPDNLYIPDFVAVPHYDFDQQRSSLFCFSGSEQGVKNLIEILPLIEESGCEWYWNKTGESRIEISWEDKPIISGTEE